MKLKFFIWFFFCAFYPICQASEEIYSNKNQKIIGKSKFSNPYNKKFQGYQPSDQFGTLDRIFNSSWMIPEENSEETTETSDSLSPQDNSVDSKKGDLKKKPSFSSEQLNTILAYWTKEFLEQIIENNVPIQKLITLFPEGNLKKLPKLFGEFQHWNITKDSNLQDKFNFANVKKIIEHSTKVFYSDVNKSLQDTTQKYENVYLQQAQLFSPEATLHTFGDQHAGFFDLIKIINCFMDSSGTVHPESPFDENLVLKEEFKNVYYVGLGDYVDGGHLNVETLLTLLTLKIKNPKNVFLVRGNHEAVELNEHYGCAEELQNRFGSLRANMLLKTLEKLYQSMPVVLFAIFKNQNAIYNVFQLCHGGIETEQTKEAFIKLCVNAISSEKKVAYSSITISPQSESCGYQWSDITRYAEDAPLLLNKKNGKRHSRPAYNKSYVENYMKNLSDEQVKLSEPSDDTICIRLREVIRGHQQYFGYKKPNKEENFENKEIVDNVQEQEPAQDTAEESEDDTELPNTHIMDILFANKQIAHHWERQNAPVITAGAGLSSGFGIPIDDETDPYPGVVALSVPIICNNGQTLAFINLPNTHIPKETIKISAKLYTKLLIETEKLLDLTHPLSGDQKDFLLLLSQEYRQKIGKSIRHAMPKELKIFIQDYLTVTEPQVFAIFSLRPDEGIGFEQDLNEYNFTDLDEYYPKKAERENLDEEQNSANSRSSLHVSISLTPILLAAVAYISHKTALAIRVKNQVKNWYRNTFSKDQRKKS